MQLSPTKIEIVGAYLAIQWENSTESIIDAKTLRENSPSAENKGESDLFGNLSKSKRTSSNNIQILNFEKIGNFHRISMMVIPPYLQLGLLER